jgi:hypothetical protein
VKRVYGVCRIAALISSIGVIFSTEALDCLQFSREKLKTRTSRVKGYDGYLSTRSIRPCHVGCYTRCYYSREDAREKLVRPRT